MSTSSSTGAPLLGAVLADRYEVVRLIARGGMGDVYEAQDRLLRRQVAVKVYRATALTDRSRFDAEITTLAALNHPSLVQVYDAGEHEGDGFVVLELVDGPTLSAIVAEDGPLAPEELARLGAAVADALAYVHEAGVVHRDVTPSNVLCGRDGRPRLADFGIARLLDTSRVTAVATTIGTAAYMAPEQVEGKDVTPAADVYALGLVLLEGLTGRPGFTGSSHEVAVARLVRSPDVAAGVPDAWQPLLSEMTAREPAERPSAAHVSERLRELAQGAPAIASAGAPVPAPGAAVAGAAAAASVVVGNDDVDGAAATAVVPAVSAAAAGAGDPTGIAAGGSQTTVMPATLLPADESADEPAAEARPSAGAVGMAGAAGAGAAGVAAASGASGRPATSSRVPDSAAARSRRALWVAGGAIAAVMLVALAARGDDNLPVPPPTTDPVAVTVPVTEPPTTLPPTTEELEREHEGQGKGKGRNKESDDD